MRLSFHDGSRTTSFRHALYVGMPSPSSTEDITVEDVGDLSVDLARLTASPYRASTSYILQKKKPRILTAAPEAEAVQDPLNTLKTRPWVAAKLSESVTHVCPIQIMDLRLSNRMNKDHRHLQHGHVRRHLPQMKGQHQA
jgi:hypothetical protein